MDSLTSTAGTTKTEASSMSRDTLTINDNRTGKVYEVPITNGTIKAMDLRQIKTDPNDFGIGKFRCQSECDDAAAGSNVDHARKCDFGFEV